MTSFQLEFTENIAGVLLTLRVLRDVGEGEKYPRMELHLHADLTLDIRVLPYTFMDSGAAALLRGVAVAERRFAFLQ
jgi:hypothetical protein